MQWPANRKEYLIFSRRLKSTFSLLSQVSTWQEMRSNLVNFSLSRLSHRRNSEGGHIMIETVVCAIITAVGGMARALLGTLLWMSLVMV